MGSGKQKFKVGDRVRRVGFSEWPQQFGEVGKEYTVLDVPHETSIVVIEDESGADSSCFELVEQPAKWVPKVGDLVRVTRHCNYNGDKIDMEAPIGSIQVIEKLSNQLSDYGLQAFSLRGFKRHIYLMLNVETLSVPAAFTITAGKFYKTRAGRKVGPMKTWNDLRGVAYDDRLCVVEGNGSYWMLDGTGVCADDIIAEWVDEPVAVAPAKPKFNVGDIVKFRDDYGSSARGKRAAVINVSRWGIQVDLGGAYGVSTESPDDLVLFSAILPKRKPTAIVALIENGQPKPATRPKIHVDQQAATAEAERLALAYPGQEFGVFVLADSKIADTVKETVTRSVLRAA